jgi:hypothetical protein
VNFVSFDVEGNEEEEEEVEEGREERRGARVVV